MATDVLVNFVQRWLKQAEPKQKGQLLPLPEVPLLPTTLASVSNREPLVSCTL